MQPREKGGRQVVERERWAGEPAQERLNTFMQAAAIVSTLN